MTRWLAAVCRRSWNRKAWISACLHADRKAVRIWLKGDQRIVDDLVDGGAAGLAALRPVERDRGCQEIHSLPLEAKQLALPHPRVHRERDDGQGWSAASKGLAGSLWLP